MKYLWHLNRVYITLILKLCLIWLVIIVFYEQAVIGCGSEHNNLFSLKCNPFIFGIFLE